jgi:hypothetical protein
MEDTTFRNIDMGVRDPAADDVHRDRTAATTRSADDQVVEAHSIPRDDAFRLLQSGRRRAVLRFLSTTPSEGPFSVAALARVVAAVEADDPSDERVERVRTALYHTHLPRLAAAGVVAYDGERGRIEATPLLAAFEGFLADGLHAAGDLTVYTVEGTSN